MYHVCMYSSTYRDEFSHMRVWLIVNVLLHNFVTKFVDIVFVF